MSGAAGESVWHRAHAIPVPPRAGGGTLSWTGPALMGVLNVTPDSFSDGGRWPDAEAAVAAGRRMADEGAVVVDVGGESSRPGAAPVSEDEELRRVVPVVRGLAGAGVRVSIDTTKPGVVIDPGIGFGKRVEHNLALLRAVPLLAASGVPVLVGASRKSLLRSLAGVDDPAERLPGTLVLHLAAARGGAAMLRVHDVAAHLQALRVAAAVDGAAGWVHG